MHAAQATDQMRMRGMPTRDQCSRLRIAEVRHSLCHSFCGTSLLILRGTGKRPYAAEHETRADYHGDRELFIEQRSAEQNCRNRADHARRAR